MLTHVRQHYDNLSPKGRAILTILIADYELHDNEGLTRRQIAEQLGQVRLYPHDDRAIKRLEDIGFIYISEERLGRFLAQQYNDFSFIHSNNIRNQTIFHIHWLNIVFYPYLIPMLKEDGLYSERGLENVGNVVGTAWSRVKRLLGNQTK